MVLVKSARNEVVSQWMKWYHNELSGITMKLSYIIGIKWYHFTAIKTKTAPHTIAADNVRSTKGSEILLNYTSPGNTFNEYP